jgi:glycogen debranching enzyme
MSDDLTNEPSYNTVDASLWYIHACFEYPGQQRPDTFERACRRARPSSKATARHATASRWTRPIFNYPGRCNPQLT